MSITWTKPKISFALSVLAVFMGSIGLFTDNWIEGPYWNAGFIKGCVRSVCMSIPSGINRARQATNNDTAFETIYVLGIIGVIYAPLIFMFSAAVLKGIRVRWGPSELRDVSATVCVWLATYHGFGLTILFIILAAAKNQVGYKMLGRDPKANIGWSAYVSLVAFMIGFASAVTSCPACKKKENEQDDEESVRLDAYE